jgi:hypothetical protein
MSLHETCRTICSPYWTRSTKPPSLSPQVEAEMNAALDRGVRFINQLLPSAMPCLTQLRLFTLHSYHAFVVKGHPTLGTVICFPATEFAEKMLFTLATYNRLRNAFYFTAYNEGTIDRFLDGLDHIQNEGRFHYMHLCSLPTKLDPSQEQEEPDSPNIHPSASEPATYSALLYSEAHSDSVFNDIAMCVDMAGMSLPSNKQIYCLRYYMNIAGRNVFVLDDALGLSLIKHLPICNPTRTKKIYQELVDTPLNSLHIGRYDVLSTVMEYYPFPYDSILPTTLLTALYEIDELSAFPPGLLPIVVSCIDPVGSHMPPRHMGYPDATEVERDPFMKLRLESRGKSCPNS